MMRKIGLWLLLGFISFSVFSSENDFFFFSKKDREAIARSAKTEWGNAIIADLKEVVAERRKHELAVPLLEGGHFHDYFCPVHNLMFEFDWEKPMAHFCVACDSAWKGHKRADWAWVNKVHGENLKYLTASMYIYLATGEEEYAGFIRDMLLDYAGKYPTYFEHNVNRVATTVNGGKMFGQSLDEAVWASDAARAFNVAREVMTSAEIEKIETGYLQPCADMLLNRKYGGNWQVWHNSGLIALGVALRNDSIVDVALNDGKCGYYHLFRQHVYDDGWWSEGSPIYHFYPLRAMLLSADAVRCRGIDLYDEKLFNMLYSPSRGVYADLKFPAHNDGWYGESLVAQVKLYEIAYKRYGDPQFRNILSHCYAKTERLDPEALLNPENIEAGNGFFQQEGVNFPDLGVGILRSGHKTVVLKYGPHGGGHGHPDKLSISVHDGEKEIVTDMGTSAYGVPDFTRWYRKTVAHNTVVVDKKDQVPSTGKLISFETSADGGTVEAMAEDAYPGVKMERNLRLKKNMLTDEFRCESGENRVYDYVLIFSNPVSLADNGKSVEWDDEPGYRIIENVKNHSAPASFTCKTDGAEIRFTLPKNVGFEVFTGEAPGIPPSNPAARTGQELGKIKNRKCYPLIIRVKGEQMNIKAVWKFEK